MYRNLFYGNEAFRAICTVWDFFLLNITHKDTSSIIWDFNYGSKLE